MKRITSTLLICAAFNVHAWEFDENQDDMTGKPVRSAFIISDNQLDLKWPYGIVTGFLGVRNHPRYGRDITVSVNKGQMLCFINDCSVLVRFDDRPPMRFTGNTPADHSRTSIFIDGYDRFIKELKQSSVVRIEISFYQQGTKSLVFKTADFPIDRFAPAAIKKKR